MVNTELSWLREELFGRIVARTHRHDAARTLRQSGIDLIVMGEQQLAVKMVSML